MPLFMDVHRNVEGATQDALRESHQKDVDLQGQFDVHYDAGRKSPRNPDARAARQLSGRSRDRQR
jgi:hypothetical protein